MIPPIPQLMLSFSPSGSRKPGAPGGARRRAGEPVPATLRVLRSVSEYFDEREGETYDVSLPPAIELGAPADPRGWRRNPQQGKVALELGRRLWEQLPTPVQRAIRDGTPDHPQRVAIVSTCSGMDEVPWEWLNADPQELVAATDAVRFVRLVPLLFAPPPLTVAPPIRVLVLVTNPKDERVLRADVEIDVVAQALRSDARYALRVLQEPGAEALREALAWSPHVVHYVGHAGVTGAAGNIILHDEADGTRWLSPQQVASALPASARLLCLSTCVTAPNYEVAGLVKFAHAPPEIALPTTIANQYALEGQAAAAFWSAFYPALVDRGGDAVEAVHAARMAVRAAPGVDPMAWASFTLVIRDGLGQPLRLGAPQPPSADRFAAEIQAQWSTRMANSLAERMRSLAPPAQAGVRQAMRSEEERIESFTRDIEKE